MDDPHTGEGDAPADAATGVEGRRAVAGGLTVLSSIVGFTLVRAAVDARGLPEEWVLVALPGFGLVVLVGFAVFLSAVVPD
jgi:hypothetical protein